MAKAQAKTKPKPQYREGTLGWYLVNAGWTPVEQTECERGGNHKKDQVGKCERCGIFPHPLWQFGDIGELLPGWEARRVELIRIHNEFKPRAKGVGA